MLSETVAIDDDGTTLLVSHRGEASALASETLRSGSVLGGRYRVSNVLGEGAFGKVYAAERLADGRSVAIKVMHDLRDRAHGSRFRQEARLARRAHHPNVVRVLECGVHERETAYLVMERIDGVSLARRLDSGPLRISEVLSLARDVLCAIDAFSSRGIIHRDLKPANVMRDDRDGCPGRWKVIDFGIAESVAARARAARAGIVIGTPRYMAPEQLRGEAVDVRTDLYALGALLYEAITGEPCHGRTSLVDSIAATLHDEVAPLRELHPECPPALERLVLRALEKDPRKRPQSAGEMLAELERIAARFEAPRWSPTALLRRLCVSGPRGPAKAPVSRAPSSAPLCGVAC